MMEERDLLLEIGVEELPTSCIGDIFQELEEKSREVLSKFRLRYSNLQVWGTPRRMVVYVEGLSEKQEPLLTEVQGPAKKVGMAEDGTWLQPALAFARSQGISPSELLIKETDKGVYIFGRKKGEGRCTTEVLPDLLRELITSLEFQRSMLWGMVEFRFVRPIRWLVALFGEEEIHFSIAGVWSSRQSFGHRFWSSGAFSIPSAFAYRDCLREQKVIVDPKERRRIIERCLDRESYALGGHWLRDEALIEEVTFLVEYPEAATGQFDPKYLELPPQVLITVMKHHQKYFACVDDQGKLLPYFLMILNHPKDHAEKIVHGNERVLRARLEDAFFFFKEDRKKTLAERLPSLGGVVFQEDLGTMREKTDRLVTMSRILAKILKLGEEEVVSLERAALLAKADLVSEMVKEFPELQGYIGKTYALLDGEKEEVALAIEESYFPRPGEENYPETLPGTVLSLVDKMDTLVSSFALGRIPSGSFDPLGLRRMAQGIVDILLHRRLYVSLSEWIGWNLDLLEKQGFVQFSAQITKDVREFILNRLRSRLLFEGINYSVINAVLATVVDDVYEAMERIVFLDGLLKNRKEFLSAIVTGFTRANNISRGFSDDGEIQVSLLKEEVEYALYEKLKVLQGDFVQRIQSGEYEKAVESFSDFLPILNLFFDKVLVMCDQEDLRKNRLLLMKKVVRMWESFANLSLLVVEGI
ncbi:MAG: glycine--tRNA ligase subunit beta [Candidatus Caldatribacteriaceae bacterium]